MKEDIATKVIEAVIAALHGKSYSDSEPIEVQKVDKFNATVRVPVAGHPARYFQIKVSELQ